MYTKIDVERGFEENSKLNFETVDKRVLRL